MSNRLGAVLLILVCSLVPVRANTDNEISAWQSLFIDIPVTEKIFIREVFSARQKETFTEADVTLVRSTLNYEFNKDFIVTASYDWFKLYNSSAGYENRPWQQIYYRHNTPIDKLRLFHRFRVDERMVEDSDTQIRLRYMAAFEYPLPKDITLQVSDELMVNANSNERSDAGLDQNRIAIALIKKFNSTLSTSLTYQFQHFFDDRDLINHGILLGLILNFR